jgi:hypothetical protein
LENFKARDHFIILKWILEKLDVDWIELARASLMADLY